MSHSFKSNYFHIIWTTKNRYPWILPNIEIRLYPYINEIIKKNKSHLLAIGGIEDHLHLLIKLQNIDNFSTLIKLIKSYSSFWLKKNFVTCSKFSWQPGYAVFTVSYSGIEAVKKYINNQKTHHKKINFNREYKIFLNMHANSGVDKF